MPAPRGYKRGDSVYPTSEHEADEARSDRLRGRVERQELRNQFVQVTLNMVYSVVAIPFGFYLIYAHPELQNAPGIASVGAFVTLFSYVPKAVERMQRRRRENGHREPTS